MKFYGPLKSLEDSIKTNPKQVLIVVSIFLVLVIFLLIGITILIIYYLGFSLLLLLPRLLLGGIASWLIICVIKCIINLKRREK